MPQGQQALAVKLKLLGIHQAPSPEHHRDGELGEHPGPLPPPGARTGRKHPGEPSRQPHRVRQPTQQDCHCMPDQPLSVGRHGQPTIPPRTLAHQKGVLTPAPDTT